MLSRPVRTQLRRIVSFVAGIVALSALCAIVLLSPMILLTALGKSADWTQLSNMGQAYGGVAALIAAVALLGIAISLFLQWKQARLQQMFAIRERHFELIKLGLEQPHLLQIFSTHGERVDPIYTYASLFIVHWVTLWDLDALPEETLRRNCTNLFTTRTVRSWWLDTGPSFLDQVDRNRQRFLQILDEECHRAEVMSQHRNQPPPCRGDDGSSTATS